MGSPVEREARWRVLVGDCVEVNEKAPADSVDAVVTDPPYAIGSLKQGDQEWDQYAIRKQARSFSQGRPTLGEGFEIWCERWAKSCFRVMRPGAHLFAFGAPRTFHRMIVGVEDAGFEIRDVLMWLYSSGMVKSRKLSGGRTTAIKPAYEPILMARKPLGGTTSETIARHGTGALEAESCRTGGRLPANVVFSHNDHCRSDRCESDCPVARVEAGGFERRPGFRLPIDRVFYCSKAPRRERDAGCELLPARPFELLPRADRRSSNGPRLVKNSHPTVKPIELMRWLVRLGCPPGGLVLDPFCGSGTTGIAAMLEGRSFVGIEKSEVFAEIAQARITHWAAHPQTEREATR